MVFSVIPSTKQSLSPSRSKIENIELDGVEARSSLNCNDLSNLLFTIFFSEARQIAEASQA